MRGPAVALALAAAGLLAGCARSCGGAAAEDAGTPSPPPLRVEAPAPAADAGARVRRSTDLRTVLLQAFPEYRGTNLVSAEATLARRVAAIPPAVRDEWLAKLGYQPVDGGEGWFRPPFTLVQRSPTELAVSMPFDAAFLFSMFEMPSPISTMDMAQWLPRPLEPLEEVFTVDLHYEATPQRAAYLVKQAVELLLGNGQWTLGPVPEGWEPRPADGGGYGAIPRVVDVTVTSVQGATVRFLRDAGRVRVSYRLVTVDPG